MSVDMHNRIHAMNGMANASYIPEVTSLPDMTKAGEYWLWLTPDIARKLLETNFDNPRKRKRNSTIKEYAETMKAGFWRNDHPTPITISVSRGMIDGQHRVEAVILSGVTIRVKLVTGADNNLAKTMGGGLPRQLSDTSTFSIDPVMNQTIAQIVKCGVKIKENNFTKRPNEVYEQEFLDHRDGYVFAAEHCGRKHKGVGRTPIGVALVQMWERNPTNASEFIQSVLVPDGSVQQARMLRDYVLRNSPRGGVLGSVDLYERAVFCMKCYLDDREVRQVKRGKW